MGVNCNTGQGSTNKKGMLDGVDWIYRNDTRQSPEGLYYHDMNGMALTRRINKKSNKVVLAGDGSIET
eukprot:14311921-Ditylum_brightwellii.AAC.1